MADSALSASNSSAAFDAERVRKNGWRQGSSIPSESFASLPVIGEIGWSGKEHVATIISQDCDVVQPSLDREPYVEVLRGRWIDELSGNLTHGKNPRTLQVATQHSDLAVEYSIHDRVRVSRMLLQDCSPADKPRWTTRTTASIAQWVASRYTRAAFPDAFNERLKKAGSVERIKKIGKRAGRAVSGVYIFMDEEEKLEAESYGITVVVTAPDDSYELEGDTIGKGFLEPLIDALAAAPGVVVEKHGLLPERDFSMTMIRNSLRLDLDSLSFAIDDAATNPAP
jgi:hypothetical protein